MSGIPKLVQTNKPAEVPSHVISLSMDMSSIKPLRNPSQSIDFQSLQWIFQICQIFQMSITVIFCARCFWCTGNNIATGCHSVSFGDGQGGLSNQPFDWTKVDWTKIFQNNGWGATSLGGSGGWPEKVVEDGMRCRFIDVFIRVVPHKAVAEVSKMWNL